MNAPDERDLVDDGLEDDPEEAPEAEVHELGLDLADGELDVAVGGEDEVHVHDDLVAAHVLVVDLQGCSSENKMCFPYFSNDSVVFAFFVF